MKRWSVIAYALLLVAAFLLGLSVTYLSGRVWSEGGWRTQPAKEVPQDDRKQIPTVEC